MYLQRRFSWAVSRFFSLAILGRDQTYFPFMENEYSIPTSLLGGIRKFLNRLMIFFYSKNFHWEQGLFSAPSNP